MVVGGCRLGSHLCRPSRKSADRIKRKLSWHEIHVLFDYSQTFSTPAHVMEAENYFLSID